MKNVVIGLFENSSRAQMVAQELAKAGFDRGDIHQASSESEFIQAIGGDSSNEESRYHTDEIWRGGSLIWVETEPDRAGRVMQIMRSHGARIPSHWQDERESPIPNDLRRLSDLKDFEIADNEIDPRGWDLIGRDGEKIGKIDGLLASPSARKAYFAVIDTGGWMKNKLFAIPLADVSFDRNQKEARVPYIKDQFRGAPEYHESDRDYHRYHDYWIGSTGGYAGAVGSGRR